MTLTYAGIPQQLNAPITETIAGNLTAPVSGNLFLQARNRQGFNLISNPSPIALSAGQGVRATIPDCMTGMAWDILYFYILFSPDTYENAAIVARYAGSEPLPGTVDLTHDSHFEREVYLVAEGELPANRVEGMRRYVDSWGEIREWDGTAWTAVRPQSFAVIVSTTTSTNGCDRPLPFDPSPILLEDYAADGSDSNPVNFWLRNDTSQPFFKGLGIRVNIYAAGEDLTSAFFAAGALKLIFGGYVDVATGVRDVADMGYVDEEFTYYGNEAGLFLEKDLPPGYAYAVGVVVNATPPELNGRIGNGTRLDVEVTVGDRAGTYLSVARYFGDFINSDYDKRAIVPARGLYARALAGTGVVKGFVFNAGERTVYGLEPNTANQAIAINGNGACYKVDSLAATQALRASVGTLDGVGTAVLAGAVELDSTKALRVSLTHATEIREGADLLIAGSAKGELNATGLRVWAIGAGTSIYFDLSVDLDTAEQTWDIASAGTVGAVEASSLGLYLPDSAVLGTVAGASSFVEGTYEIFLAYRYENTVTAISMVGDGIIRQMSGTIFDELEAIASKKALVLG